MFRPSLRRGSTRTLKANWCVAPPLTVYAMRSDSRLTANSRVKRRSDIRYALPLVYARFFPKREFSPVQSAHVRAVVRWVFRVFLVGFLSIAHALMELTT